MNHRSWTGFVLLSAALALPQIASAQLEEVVVSAQRRTENVQDVPISVSAVSRETLQDFAVRDVLDMSATAPGLHMAQQLQSPLLFIRGIGTASTQGGQEGSTAFYVDGVYYPHLPGLNFAFNDIERIEVLKGPQGTLFGRNATGGLLQIITRTPSQDPSLDMEATYGNFDTLGGKLYGTMGFGENVAGSISLVGSAQRDGWGTNVVTGQDTGKVEMYGARSNWLFTPGDNTTFRLGVDYASTRTTQGVARQAAPGARTVDGVGALPDFYDTRSNFGGQASIESYGAALTFTQNFKSFDLVSITSYRKNEAYTELDQDSTPIPLVNAPLYDDAETVSQEIQFVSTNSERFQWIAGLYYIDIDFYNRLDLNGLAFAMVGLRDDKESTQPTQSYAAYVQSTFALGDASRVTLGARYTSDERKLRGQDTFGNGVVVPVNTSAEWEELTWRASYDYQFNDDLMAYASYNRGFKGGLFNMVNLTQPPVKPEIVDAYEIGLKSTLADGRARLNLSAYYYDYQDMQVQFLEAGITRLSNAASSEMYGAEIELQYQYTDRLNVFAGISFMDSEYKDFPGAPLSVPNPPPAGGNSVTSFNAAGNDVVHAPGFSGSVAANYTIPTSSGNWGLSGSYIYNGSFYWEPDNRNKQEGISIVNLELSWQDPGERYRVFAYGRNLLDEEYTMFLSGGTLGDIAAPAAPLTYGIGFGLSFK